MRLYNFDVSPFASRVRLAAYAKDLPLELLSAPEGGLRSDAYRAINPLGKIPALVLDDGTVIIESQVIVEYLEDRYPQPALLPQNLEARAKARLIARFVDIYLNPPFHRLLGQLFSKGPRDQSVIDQGLPQLAEALGQIERQLAPTRWAADETFTIADCALIPMLFATTRLAAGLGEPDILGNCPGLKVYWKNAGSDPHVAKLLGEMEAGVKRMQEGR